MPFSRSDIRSIHSAIRSHSARLLQLFALTVLCFPVRQLGSCLWHLHCTFSRTQHLVHHAVFLLFLCIRATPAPTTTSATNIGLNPWYLILGDKFPRPWQHLASLRLDVFLNNPHGLAYQHLRTRVRHNTISALRRSQSKDAPQPGMPCRMGTDQERRESQLTTTSPTTYLEGEGEGEGATKSTWSLLSTKPLPP